MFTIPKPPKRSKPVVRKGGREVVGKVEFKRRREQAWDRDRGICILCGLFVALEEATAEHIETRGMGGGKRDDRLPNLAVSHWGGNNARGSQSMAVYMALPQEVRERNCRGGV
jgi:hypothetical protein